MNIVLKTALATIWVSGHLFTVDKVSVKLSTMLKYVDFWYALKTTKHAQTILEGVSMETTKACAVLRNKIIIILQDSSADWRFSYLS